MTGRRPGQVTTGSRVSGSRGGDGARGCRGRRSSRHQDRGSWCGWLGHAMRRRAGRQPVGMAGVGTSPSPTPGGAFTWNEGNIGGPTSTKMWCLPPARPTTGGPFCRRAMAHASPMTAPATACSSALRTCMRSDRARTTAHRTCRGWVSRTMGHWIKLPTLAAAASRRRWAVLSRRRIARDDACLKKLQSRGVVILDEDGAEQAIGVAREPPEGAGRPSATAYWPSGGRGWSCSS